MVTVRKSRCCYLKSTLLAEKYTFLVITAGYYLKKHIVTPKKRVITKKSRLSQKKNNHIVIKKKSQDYPKKAHYYQTSCILMENLKIVIIKPDIIT